MHQIIKQVDPRSQIFETVNFAFMKIFDFLGHLSFFWDIRVMHFFPDHVFDNGRNAWRESPPKKSVP